MKTQQITTEKDLQIAFDIRKEVFVFEQNCPIDDEFDVFDYIDAPSKHILVYYDNRPVGTGRVRIDDGVGKLERICVLKNYREFGLGKLIVEELENIVRQKDLEQAKLHGQTQAEGFYHKLGYHTVSEVFIEDGIPHVLMKKDLKLSTD